MLKAKYQSEVTQLAGLYHVCTHLCQHPFQLLCRTAGRNSNLFLLNNWTYIKPARQKTYNHTREAEAQLAAQKSAFNMLGQLLTPLFYFLLNNFQMSFHIIKCLVHKTTQKRKHQICLSSKILLRKLRLI